MYLKMYPSFYNMAIDAEPANDFDSNNDVQLCQVVALADAAFAASKSRGAVRRFEGRLSTEGRKVNFELFTLLRESFKEGNIRTCLRISKLVCMLKDPWPRPRSMVICCSFLPLPQDTPLASIFNYI